MQTGDGRIERGSACAASALSPADPECSLPVPFLVLLSSSLPLRSRWWETLPLPSKTSLSRRENQPCAHMEKGASKIAGTQVAAKH